MPESSENEILQLVDEIARRTARIQSLAAQIAAAHTLDRTDADILETHLDIAIDALKSVQRMASYLSRPVKETSRLWRNGSGQYETRQDSASAREAPSRFLSPTSTIRTVLAGSVPICDMMTRIITLPITQSCPWKVWASE